MTTQRTDILFPVGRIVQGSLYKARDKDADGNPLLVKNGPNKGQARVDFYIAVAIPKQAGHTHWAQTDWGSKIYQVGAAAFPNAYQSPAFAWKIEDGDSQVPNKRGRKPCDQEGFPGHWIVKMSGGYAPKVYQQPNPGVYVELTQPDAVKTGYWVQVSGNCAGNGSAQQPGVYVNHGMVLFVRPDAEIVSGPDAATVFAGAAVSAALPGAVPGAAMPFAPPQPLAPPQMVAPPQPIAVAPNPAFLAPPPTVAAAVPMPPALPVPGVPAAPIRAMTPKAAGATYESFIQQGWNDALLVQHGYMTA